MTDHYETLGIERTANTADIREAFRRLLYLHPDKHPGDPSAGKRFAQIVEAHAELSDPARRAKYDADQASASAAPGGSRSALLRELVVEELTGMVELAGEIGSTAHTIDPARAAVRLADKATSAEGRQQIRGFWGALRGLVGS